MNQGASHHEPGRYGSDRHERERPELRRAFSDATQNRSHEEQGMDELDGPTKEEADVMEEVSDKLEEMWKLDEAERRKPIKALRLKWHPDKNLDNERMATIITQHISAELDRLEKGLPRPSTFFTKFNFDARNIFKRSTTFQRNFEDAFKRQQEQLEAEAKARAEARKQKRRQSEENISRGNQDSQKPMRMEDVMNMSRIKARQNQAKHMFDEAQEELHDADQDYEKSEKPAYEWICFKAEKAGEKALQAAQYSEDGVARFGADLDAIIGIIDDVHLRRLAKKLQIASKTDPIEFLVLSEDDRRGRACDAINCATDVLDKVRIAIGL